jgi:hypothetical protein
MATLQLQMHAGVVPQNSPTWRQRAHSAHLAQGALDGACGAYSVFQALIVLGVASKAHVRCLKRIAQSDRLEHTWNQAIRNFFIGTDDDDMDALLQTLADQVERRRVTGSMRRVLAFALERLAAGEVVIVGFEDEGMRGGHWVTAVGVEELVSPEGRAVTGILCLDSGEVAPAIAPFNTRLDLRSQCRGARHLHYRVPGGIRMVTCTSAIALSRRRPL